MDVPEFGAIFTFGRSKFADDAPSHFFIRNDPIVEISCGHEHTAVVCQNGRVFSFGSNESGQLGLGHNDVVTKPSCVKTLKSEKVNLIACGGWHTIFSTANNKLYACGSNDAGQLGVGRGESGACSVFPILAIKFENEIVQLSAGRRNSALLTAEGYVFVWGCNKRGQLGLQKLDNNAVEIPISLPLGDKIIRVSCGRDHTAFITEEGKMLVCGETKWGKCGVNDRDVDVIWSPRVVTINDRSKAPVVFTDVSCGGDHTAALTDEGGVYVCGDNKTGQIGLRGVKWTSAWSLLESYGSESVIIAQVSCGENHSMFVSADARLYGCGSTKFGKLGVSESYPCIWEPQRIVFPLKFLNVKKVTCGGLHTMVFAAPVTTAMVEEPSILKAYNPVDDMERIFKNLRIHRPPITPTAKCILESASALALENSNEWWEGNAKADTSKREEAAAATTADVGVTDAQRGKATSFWWKRMRWLRNGKSGRVTAEQPSNNVTTSSPVRKSGKISSRMCSIQ